MADISKIKLPNNTTYDLKGKILEVKLTNEDLNDVNTVGFYYAAGGNTVTNKPSGYNNFGLVVIHNASGSQYTQIISNENGSYRRTKKSDSTWTSWVEDKFTDENVKQSAITISDTGWRRVLLGSNNDDEQTTQVYKNVGVTYQASSGYLSINNKGGTKNTSYYNELRIGNSTASTADGHAKGRLRLYADNNRNVVLTTEDAKITGNRTLYLPDKDGTIATEEDTAVALQLASDADLNDIKTVGFYYSPSGNSILNKPTGFNQFGLIVVRSATSANYYKQILIRPNEDGEEWVRTCTNGTWSSWTQNLFTDENVKQTSKTDNADYRVLLSKNASDSEETDGVNKNTNLKYNPDTTILTSPKLNVTSTINASGTADNKPAMMIGPVTGTHLEMDQNEIMAKGSGTTTSTLHLNADGSNVTINNNSNSVTLGNGMIDLRNGGSNTDFPLKVNLNRRSPSETPGEDIRPMVVYYQTKDLNGDTQGRTAYPFAVIGNNATNTNNTGVRLGSHNGTTIVGAGESSLTFASAQSHYNDENLYLTADGKVHIYQGLTNESDSYKAHITLPYHDHHDKLDADANEFVTAYQRNCIVGNDNAVSATARWYDAGDLYLDTANTDFTSMFTVYNTYSTNNSSKEAAGLLFVHARVGSDKAYQYAYMKFIANSGFDVSHFRLAWRNITSGTVFTLFTYIDTRYIRRRFTEISQGLRFPSTDNPSNGNYRFNMYDGSTAFTNDQITNNWNGYIEAT